MVAERKVPFPARKNFKRRRKKPGYGGKRRRMIFSFSRRLSGLKTMASHLSESLRQKVSHNSILLDRLVLGMDLYDSPIFSPLHKHRLFEGLLILRSSKILSLYSLLSYLTLKTYSWFPVFCNMDISNKRQEMKSMVVENIVLPLSNSRKGYKPRFESQNPKGIQSPGQGSGKPGFPVVSNENLVHKIGGSYWMEVALLLTKHDIIHSFKGMNRMLKGVNRNCSCASGCIGNQELLSDAPSCSRTKPKPGVHIKSKRKHTHTGYV